MGGTKMKKLIAITIGLAAIVSAMGQKKEPPRMHGAGGYSIEQACSDRAQLNTIAFDALGFLTGDLCSSTFLPPGKISDYFGFQYMRDIDTGTGGHNTGFLTRIANNVWVILNKNQKDSLIALAREQAGQIQNLAHKRFPLIKAFHRELDKNIPSGTQGLNQEAVKKCSGELFELDGLLGYRRAQIFGAVARSLDETQKAAFSKLVFGRSETWPEMDEQIDKRGFTHDEHVALMTYASEFFSWYAGSVEADTYFCPERHGTYFGSFYMKDAPAMGKRNYSISTSLTGDKGEAFLNTLTAPQQKLITSLVDLQRADLGEIVTTRRAISVELRRFMKSDTVDRQKVLALARRYGELDGEISWYYATHFAQVGRGLDATQRQTLMKLRDLAEYKCDGAYLYSERIPSPAIPDTDFLFRTVTGTGSQ
jgi:hypothetical protein